MPKAGKNETKVALVDFVIEGADVHLDEETNRLVGVAAKVDIVNRNNRLYTREVFEKAVSRVQDAVLNGAFTGELDHPKTDALGSLKDTAFLIDQLKVEGDQVVFGARLFDTDAGRNLKALLDGGMRVGMSTRGVGSVKWQKTEGKEVAVIQDDFEILGIDAVKVPSNEAGIVRLRESLEALTEQQQLKPPVEREEPVGQNNQDETKVEDRTQALTAQVSVLETELATARSELETVTGERDAARAELEQTKATLEGVRKAIVGEDTQDNDPIDETSVAVAVRGMQAQIESLKASLEAKEQEAAEAVRKAQVRDHFEKALSEHPFATILREEVKPDDFATAEALDAKLESLTRLLQRVQETGTPRGKGIVEDDESKAKAKVKVSNPLLDESYLAINADLMGGKAQEA